MAEGETSESNLEIKPEMGQFLAQRCAQSIDNIAETVYKIKDQSGRILPHRITPSLSCYVIDAQAGKFDLIGHPDRIKGPGDNLYGKHFINFDYDKEELQQSLKETYGVDTPCILGVSLHTDIATLPRIMEHLRNGGTTEFMYTYYYFDHQGRYAKTIALPKEWEDKRSIVSQNKWYKTLRAEMTPEDFELAGGALEFLRDELSKAGNPNQDSE